MVKPEWGAKRICLNCGARFYDLQRDPIVCPACATPFDPTAQNRPRRARAAPKVAAALASATLKATPSIEDDEVEAEVEEEEEVAVAAEEADDEAEDEAESAIEDVSELGDDDIDVIDTELDEEDAER